MHEGCKPRDEDCPPWGYLCRNPIRIYVSKKITETPNDYADEHDIGSIELAR